MAKITYRLDSVPAGTLIPNPYYLFGIVFLGPYGIYQEVNFGDQTGLNNAVTAIRAYIESTWQSFNVSDLFTITAFSATQVNGEVNVTFEFTVDDSVFTESATMQLMPNNIFAGYNATEIIYYFTSNFAYTPETCHECKKIQYIACEDTYLIKAGLTAGTQYTVEITDLNNVAYTQALTADGNGDLTLDATANEFPAGFFTPEMSPYVLKVYSDSDRQNIVDLTNGTQVYQCVKLSFQYVVTTTSTLPQDLNFLITENLDFVVTEYGDRFICI